MMMKSILPSLLGRCGNIALCAGVAMVVATLPQAAAAQTATNLIDWDFNTDSDFNDLKNRVNSDFHGALSRRTEGSDNFMRVVLRPNDGNFTTTNNLSEEIRLFADTDRNSAPQGARLRYKMRFSSDFRFERQGKLPGLSSFIPHYGGNANDAPVTYSWSYRTMWFPGTPVDKRPDVYIYDQNRIQGNTGKHYTAPASVYVFPKNQWFTLAMEIHLNTTDSSGNPRSDGIARQFIGSTQVNCVDGLKFRGKTASGNPDDWRVGRFAFHVYHGGAKGTLELPPAGTTNYVDFDYIDIDRFSTLSATDPARKC